MPNSCLAFQALPIPSLAICPESVYLPILGLARRAGRVSHHLPCISILLKLCPSEALPFAQRAESSVYLPILGLARRAGRVYLAILAQFLPCICHLESISYLPILGLARRAGRVSGGAAGVSRCSSSRTAALDSSCSRTIAACRSTPLFPQNAALFNILMDVRISIEFIGFL